MSAKMRFILLAIIFIIAGCTEQPGPLPLNMSRIQVKCMGVNLGSAQIEVVDASNNNRIGETKELSCVFYGEVNFDVPVPPYSFNVREIDDNDGRILIGSVTFSGPGETKTARVVLYKTAATEQI